MVPIVHKHDFAVCISGNEITEARRVVDQRGVWTGPICGGTDIDWTSDAVGVVPSGMAMIPKETVLSLCGEPEGQIAARKDGILRYPGNTVAISCPILNES
jgi:hypothetical protein